MVIVFELAVDGLAPQTIFVTVGGVEVVKIYQEAGAITQVFLVDVVDLLLGSDAEFFCSQHNRCAVGVIGTNVQAVVSARLLKAHPYIGLNLLQQVTKMQGTIGIG